MKLSLNTFMYGSFPLWLPSFPLEHVIDELAGIGYDGIEIGAAAPHAYPAYTDAARREAISRRVQSQGLAVSAICPAIGGGAGFNPASLDDPEREAAIRYLGDCVDLAADVGAECVTLLGGYRRYGQSQSDAWSRLVDTLQRVAQVAGRRGVRLVVEPTPADSNLLSDAGDSLRVIQDAGIDAGVMLDTAHIFHRADEVRAAFHEAGDRLAYVHLSDDGRTAPGTHRDFTTVVDELRAIGYDGWLSMEIGFGGRESDPAAVARAAHAHLSAILA